MNRSLTTRVLSLVLTVVMVIGMLPMSAFATESEEQNTTATVHFDVNGGNGTYEDQAVALGEKVTKPEADPTHDSAVFAHWTADMDSKIAWNFEENIVSESMTLYAVWTEPAVPVSEEAAYTVKHFLQTADGYAQDEEAAQMLTGIVGEKTAAEAKTYEGFVAKAFEQADIAADGSTVVEIYYDVEVKTEAPTTATYMVEHYLQTADGYELKDTDTLEGTIGDTTAAEAKEYEGFAEKTFEQAVIAVDGSTVVEIYYDVEVKTEAPATATYMVEHYLQTADGYELKDTDTLEGTIGEATAAEEKSYEGYTAKEFVQGTIAVDGTTVVVIEYDADPVEIEEEEKLTMSDVVTVITDKESTLAPGITQNLISAYDKNGDRVEMFVAVADLSVDTVGVYANYKDNQNTEYGMSKTTEQVASAEAKHEDPYSVVVAINASYYNMTTGKPTGVFVMEGNDVTTESEGNNYSFFAILKDGTPVIGGRTEYSKYKGQIAEAIGGYYHLVKDGKIYEEKNAAGNPNWNVNDTKKYPRQTIGLTADNKVIIMSADGNQAPRSIGLTLKEQAEVMIALGCVEALHLDGGGSMTYCAKPEGADTIQIMNSPSDGSERDVSNSLIFVSRAVADGTFDHAVLTAEHDYVTPESVVNISAIGADAGGGTAEIPAEGITWHVKDSAMGTVENGVFTAGKTPGDAVVQMIYNEKVVGEVTIHVVIPTEFKFNTPQIVVPYGKFVELEMKVLYGVNEIVLKPGDVTFMLANEAAGTIDGFTFTACEETAEVTGSKVTAVFAYGEDVTAETEIVLGKGSKVIYDFEDGTDHGLVFSEPDGTKYNYVWPESSQTVVTAENGQVRFGNYALEAKVNYGNSLESGYMKTSLVAPEEMVFENATQVGMWLYIPDEAVGSWVRWTLQAVSKGEDGKYTFGTAVNGNIVDGGAGGTGVAYKFDEPGWHYLSVDTSAYSLVGWRQGGVMLQFYICDRDGTAFGYSFADNHNHLGRYTFYIDDITVDYSSAVEDRDPPKIKSLTYANSTMADAVELNGQTSTNNTLTFAASVEDVAASNASGLDADSVCLYVDGVLVASGANNGMIASNAMELADGVHTVKVSARDKLGNYSSKIRQITVNAASGMPTIKVVPHDSALNRILLGSVYYIDVVATDIEKVQRVTTTLDLDNMSCWQLAHMDAAEGFSASYSVDEAENIAKITITRTGEVSASGEAVLVSIPVRTWELKMGYTYPNGTKQGQNALTYNWFRNNKEFWPIYVDVEVDGGTVTFTDNSTDTFSGAGIEVQTEMWHTYANMTATEEGKAYYNTWNGGHIHTAEPIEDKAPTCTEAGYTGRTFCAVCNSPVVWGTRIAATGHSYGFADGVLKCTCGKLFNGVYTDGKVYVDGICIPDGWNGEFYYVEGEKLTGIQKVAAPDSSDEFYYDFGEDGTSKGKYTGLFYDEDAGKYRYCKMGNLASGWIMIDDEWYYFRSTTLAAQPGDYSVGGIKYHFEENGKLTSGRWIADENGTRYYYGPGYWGKGWHTLDGNTYYTDSQGYRYEGLRWICESNSRDYVWFEFTEEGVLLGQLDKTGFMTVDGDTYYVNNGVTQRGLMKLGDDYYCFHTSTGKAVYGKYQVVMTNGLMEPGVYYFDETTGKMVTPKNGIVTEDGVMYYYVDGVKTYAGLIEIDGNYYYVNSSCKVVTGTYTIYKTNGLMEAGRYYFDETGKMAELKNGIVTEDGVMYYYVDGVKTYAGLIEIDGNYYYVNTSCKVVTGTYTIYKTNGLMEAGRYYFDETGKMGELKNGIVTEDGVMYYYVDGVKTYAGLIEIDGNYYYVNTSCKVVTGTYTIYKTNGLMEAGRYYFDETGKMAELKNGIVTEDGVMYYYVDGVKTYAGLIEIDGNYYYVNSSCKVVTGTYTIYKTNGLMEAGRYYFDETGKMGELKNGIVMEADGKMYYYVDNVKTYAGLIEIDGDYYYVNSKCMVVTGYYVIYKTNGLMEAARYNFGTDGKMIR